MYVIENSFHQTAVNYVGQNCGAMQYGRVKKVTWLCLGYATIAGLLFGSLMCVFAPQLLSLYITDSQEAIQIGVARMFVDILPYFIFGIQDVLTGALRGIGASFTSMILTVLGICGVRVLWIYTVFQIPRFHNQTMLYVSYPLSWFVTLIVQLAAFLIVFGRLQKKAKLSSGA